MGADTKIEWCDYTFNPWSGCTKVSPGCANCYAEVNYSVKMRGVKWGPSGNRIVKAESGWREPIGWDRMAKRDSVRPRVFCASLADVFEDWLGPILDAKGRRLGYDPQFESFAPESGTNLRCATMDDVRARLFRLFAGLDNLDLLCLTKRPENVMPMLAKLADLMDTCEAERISKWWCERVWLGVSVENRKCLTRIDELRKVPAAIRYLSLEPLLDGLGELDLTGISWVIVGGESGPGARPCNVAWIRDIVLQCKGVGVACFVKQFGANVISRNNEVSEWLDECSIAVCDVDTDGCRMQGDPVRVNLRDKKGGDPSEWPADLRVREFPKCRVKRMPPKMRRP